MAQGESPCRQVGAGDPGRAQGQRQALCTSAPTALLGGWHSCSGQGQWVGVREQPELMGMMCGPWILSGSWEYSSRQGRLGWLPSDCISWNF